MKILFISFLMLIIGLYFYKYSPEILETENTRMDYKTKNGEKTEVLTSCKMKFLNKFDIIDKR